MQLHMMWLCWEAQLPMPGHQEKGMGAWGSFEVRSQAFNGAVVSLAPRLCLIHGEALNLPCIILPQNAVLYLLEPR